MRTPLTADRASVNSRYPMARWTQNASERTAEVSRQKIFNSDRLRFGGAERLPSAGEGTAAVVSLLFNGSAHAGQVGLPHSERARCNRGTSSWRVVYQVSVNLTYFILWLLTRDQVSDKIGIAFVGKLSPELIVEQKDITDLL